VWAAVREVVLADHSRKRIGEAGNWRNRGKTEQPEKPANLGVL
jgi:hypothetical protein